MYLRTNLFYRSLLASESYTSTHDILEWIEGLNRTIRINIIKTTLLETGWFYDEKAGQIVNHKRSFFQISGLCIGKIEQPILIQDEIGYLGILCKEINGVLHFLMQAKTEPGNINKIQISPTLQATKSNFKQAHGGAKPLYLDFFINAEQHTIIVDQIQSEQSSRFLGKRNRNIIIMLDCNTDVEDNPRYKWLTLKQIKQLLKIDNLVNMDTRTVLSCIPFYKYTDEWLSSGMTSDPALVSSIIDGIQTDILQKIYGYINNYKMFCSESPLIVPLYSLKKWNICRLNTIEEFICKEDYPFKVVYCDISIEGREVRHWGQPLFEAQGMALFGLFTRIHNEVREFLVHATPELGCFDKIEIGPTIQLEATEIPQDEIEKFFLECYHYRRGINYDVLLSEEGGRFFHEQNKNIIIEIDADIISSIPNGYWWLTYNTLNKLIQINNVVNIQLRNLLSLLEI